MRFFYASVYGWNTWDWLVGGQFRQPIGGRVAMPGLRHGQTNNEVRGPVLPIAWYVLGIRDSKTSWRLCERLAERHSL